MPPSSLRTRFYQEPRRVSWFRGDQLRACLIEDRLFEILRSIRDLALARRRITAEAIREAAGASVREVYTAMHWVSFVPGAIWAKRSIAIADVARFETEAAALWLGLEPDDPEDPAAVEATRRRLFHPFALALWAPSGSGAGPPLAS